MHTQYRATTTASPLDSSLAPTHIISSAPMTASNASSAHQSSTMPFPTHGPPVPHTRDPRVPSPEYWDGRSEVLPQRTVRRKKSSFDLRDVFKKGAQRSML